MEEKYRQLIDTIKLEIREKLDYFHHLDDEEIAELITQAVFEKSKQSYIKVEEKQEIINTIFNALRRFDILQPLLDDKNISEIMVNGPSKIFIEKNGYITRYDKEFESQEKLENVIQSIVSKVNRVVNEASPIVDARLRDGSRVSVVLEPVALNGPFLTIRKFYEKPISIRQLVEWDSISEEAASMLELMVKSKFNIFISGGTGSGKTTFLNALLDFIPREERIVTIEDSAELQIYGMENLVRLETRNENTEGKGEITIRDLIRASLRMRPERIIIGEVRGAEAIDMLQAMNTGHDGSLSTGHGNSPKDMLSRLETMVLGGVTMPIQAIRQQIASAIDIIVHLSRLRDKSRRVLEISEVLGYDDGVIELNKLFEFQEEKETENHQIVGMLRRTGNHILHNEKFKLAGIYKEV